MTKTATVNIRTPEEVKKRAESIFRQVGLNMSTAINLFLRHVANRREIPVDLKPTYVCPIAANRNISPTPRQLKCWTAANMRQSNLLTNYLMKP